MTCEDEMRVTAVYNYHYHDWPLVHFQKHGTFRFETIFFFHTSRVSLVQYKPVLISFLLHLIPSPSCINIPFMHALIYTSTWNVYTRAIALSPSVHHRHLTHSFHPSSLFLFV